MSWMPKMRARRTALAIIALSVAAFAPQGAHGEDSSAGTCRPVSERTTEVGCWVLADSPIGQLHGPAAFWHIDTYPTRASADAAKGPRSTVLQSMGTVWLLTIEDKDWRAAGSEHAAVIGPLPVIAGEHYSALFMEAIFTPGMTSKVHTHSGPEAWYTLAGETCLETPAGIQIGRPGQDVIVPAGPPMHLTATGTKQRRALVLVLHRSAQRPTTLTNDWTPKGLCKTAEPPRAEK